MIAKSKEEDQYRSGAYIEKESMSLKKRYNNLDDLQKFELATPPLLTIYIIVSSTLGILFIPDVMDGESVHNVGKAVFGVSAGLMIFVFIFLIKGTISWVKNVKKFFKGN